MRGLGWALVVVAVAGCGADLAVISDDGADESWETATGELSTGAILAFLNGEDATFLVLNDDVGLDGRAARNIVNRVRGPDEALGTADDRPLRTLAELDALPWVGTAALTALDRFVVARGGGPGAPTLVEGVSFTAGEAAAATAVCNDARLELVGFTSSQRTNLAAGRPHVNLISVASTSGIGPAALTKLRTFVAGALPPGPPQPAGCQETARSHDGVPFSADEACRAVEFLNRARMSEMVAVPKTSLDFIYRGGPSRPNGPNGRSVWARLEEFSGSAGIGATTMGGLKNSLQGWAPNGPAWDTVAATWTNRAALVNRTLHFDKVYVSRVLPRQADPNRSWVAFECVELRDTPGAPNYVTGCYMVVGADSATGCTVGGCTNNKAGTWVSARGEWNTSSGPGGYRLNLSASYPLAPPNPAVP